MKIDARVKNIGYLVKANSFCLDVETNDCLLGIYLIKKNKKIKVIASTTKKEVLEIALKNIKREHLEDKIKIISGNGLDTKEKIDTIIISNMGGRNIIGLLKNNEILKKIDTLIISPNNYQVDLKKFLCKKGFYIENEEFVRNKGYIFQIIIFQKGKRKYSKKDYFFGPVFLQKKGPLFREYYEREMKSREILISLLPKNFRLKKFQTKKEIELIKSEIED